MARPGGFSLAAALAAIVAVAFGGVLLADSTFASAEHVSRALPSAAHLSERAAALDVPEWWPGVGLGVPFAANPRHAALYPPAYLVALAPLPWSLDVLLLLHLWWAGLGAALWARRLGADVFAAALAGAATALSAPLVTAIDLHGALFFCAWLPWIGWAAGGVARAGRDGGARALVRPAAVLAAALAASCLAGGTAALFGAMVVTAAALAASDGPRGALVASAAAVLGAGLLAAVMLVPAVSAGAPGALADSGPALGSALWPLGDRRLFVGAPIATFAALALIAPGPRRRAALALWAGAAGAIAGAVANVGGQAPALGASAAACLCAAAALGCAEVAAGRGVRRAVLAAGVGALFTAAAALGGGWERGLPSLVAQLAMAGALLAWWRGVRAGLPIAAAAAVGLLVWEGRAALPRTDGAPIAAAPALVARATPDAPGRRRLSRPPRLPGSDAATAVEAHRLAAANSAARFGFAYLRGADDLSSPALEAVWRRGSSAGERVLDLYGVELVALPRTVALPANLPVVAAVDDVVLVENPHRRPRAFSTARARFYADAEALLADVFPVARDQRRGLSLATVRLVGDGADTAGGGPAPMPACAIDEPAPERVTLSCAAEAPGYAVLLDRFAPGWRAQVDGESAAIARADLAVRAVAIGAGAHEVVFSYRTPGLLLGAALSALAWANWALLLLWLRRTRLLPG